MQLMKSMKPISALARKYISLFQTPTKRTQTDAIEVMGNFEGANHVCHRSISFMKFVLDLTLPVLRSTRSGVMELPCSCQSPLKIDF
jgi:hypothetical protein